MPYLTMHVMHWLLNGLAVYIILRWVRGNFQLMSGSVFGYLIFYEYGIIARNYVLALLGLAILAAAWFRPWSNSKHWLYLGFLLTAASSVFGLWLAVPIAVSLLCKICREQGWRKAIVPLAFLGVAGLVCFLPILPGVGTRFLGKPAASKQLGNLIGMEHGPNTSKDPPALASPKQTGTEQPAVSSEWSASAHLPPKQATPQSLRVQTLARGKQAETRSSQHAVEVLGMASYWAFGQGGVEWALYAARLPMFPPQWQVWLGLTVFAFALLFLIRKPRYLALFLGMSGGVLALLVAIPLSPANFRHSCSIFLAFLFCWWLTENDPESDGWSQRLRFLFPKLSQLGNNILRTGIALIVLLQIIAGAVAGYQDYRYPLSQAKNTAQYLKTQGLLPNERCFWASYHGGTAVLAYFDNVKMYNLNREQWQSYEVWDAKYFANLQMASAEIGARLASVASAHPGKTIMILANEKLNLPLEPSHSLQLLRSFEPARKSDENFYIYRYQ